MYRKNKQRTVISYMKKKTLFISLCAAILLTGCANVDEYLDNRIKSESGITEDSEYKTFEQYTEAGKLDDEGYYLEDIFESETITIEESVSV